MSDVARHPTPTDASVVRSEEELRVGTTAAPYERVRLRKRIVTEVRTVEVEVRREELVVEREPAGDAAGGVVDDRAVGEQAPLELTLHEEQVEVVTRVVPVERVRVAVDVVAAGEEPVDAELRREVVEVSGPDGRPLTDDRLKR